MVAFLTFDTVIHLLNLEAVREASVRLGQPESLAYTIGAVEAVCLLLYVVPRTAVLGAVLLTGFLGGAAAVNLSTGQPAVNTVFAVGLGVLVWVGLGLRDHRVAALVS